MTGPRPYSADNPFAPKAYSPDNPFAQAPDPTAADFADVQGGSSVPARGTQQFGRMGPVAGTTPSQPGHMGEDLARAGLQGVTFGLADEAGAFGQAVGERLSGRTPDLMARYRELQGQEQTKLDQFANDHPVLNVGTQIAASLPLAVAAGARAGVAPVVQSLGKRMLVGAGEGAALGGVQGAAQGHPGDRLGSGIIGGVGGGVVGAAAPAVVDAVGAGVRALKGSAPNVADETGALWPSRLGRRGAVPAIAEPDQPPAFNTKALDQILQRTGRADQTVADLQRTAESYGGKPFMLADANDPLGHLAEIVGQTDTRGATVLRQAATQRAEGFTQRAMHDLTNALGTSSPNVVRQTAQLIEQRQTEARPLYQALYRAVDERGGVPVTPEIRAILEHPDARAAFRAAQETAGRFQAAGQGAATATDVVPNLYDNAGRLRDEVTHLPMEVLDRIKQHLDAPIKYDAAPNPLAPSALRRADASDKALVGSLVRHVDQQLAGMGIVDQTGTQTLWQAARQAFAGPSAEIRALRLGVKAWKMRPEEIASTLENFGTDGEREMFRAGLAREAAPKLARLMAQGESPSIVVQRGQLRAQLQAAFPSPEAFDNYQRLIGQEQTFARLYPNVAGGSQTARRLLGAQDAGQAAAAVGDVATGAPLSAIRRLMGDAGRGLYRQFQGIDNTTADALGTYLTLPQGPERQRLMAALVQRELQRRAAQRAGRVAGQVGAAQFGGGASRF